MGRIVIGLSGLAGSGKSTAAKILAREFHFVRRPMAYPLKAMIAALGVPASVLDGSREAKEAPLDILGGQTARHAMQTVGDWGRQQMHPDFWVRMWLRGVDRLDHDVVCDDIRYSNEGDAIRSLGGIVIRICRDGAGDRVNPNHSSEQIHLIPYDHLLMNNGTEADLAAELAQIIFGQIIATLRQPETLDG